MILETISLNKFIEKVLGIYVQLNREGLDGIIKDRVIYLKHLIEKDRLDNLITEDLIPLFKVIFDAQVLVGSSYSFDSFSISDISLFGLKDLKNLNRDQQEDWLMQMKIQSWLHYRGIPPLNDLKSIVKHSVCEYRFDFSSQKHLVECKNLHMGGSKNSDVLINKILAKIDQNQLNKTEEGFSTNAFKTMYLDISDYIKKDNLSTISKYDIEINVPNMTFMSKLSDDINHYVFNTKKASQIDNLVLCWHEFYKFNGQVIVLLYNSAQFGKRSNLIFDGLALEMFPMKDKRGIFSEIRFKTNFSNKDYPAEIRTTLNMLLSPEAFFVVSDEEKSI